MKTKILILSASAGQGHLRAAQALESAFKLKGDSCQVIHLDALDLSSPVLRNVYSRSYIQMVNRAPSVLGILYDSADIPWKDEKQRLAFDRLNTLPLLKEIERLAPDQIICTHFLPAELVSWLICKGRISSKHSIVVTDFDLHAMWLCRHFNSYFVALEETAEHLCHLGVSKDRTLVSGIPVDPVFSVSKDKYEMRRKYSLRPDRPVIMLSAGGFGVGPVEEILQSLSTMRNKVEVLAMCGRNQELKLRLDAVSERLSETGNISIKAMPFTTKIDEYMAASDILLGKAGGLTSSEALARGLAFAIVNPIPGQEERNSDHLLEHGIAIRCNNLPTLAYKLDGLLENEGRLALMQKNARALSHPGSSSEIVEYILASRSDPAVNSNGRHICKLNWFPFSHTNDSSKLKASQRKFKNAKRKEIVWN